MALKPLNSVGGFSVGEIPANVILANADITANKGTFNGNLLINPANNAAFGVLTDNLYYANGVPWDLQEAAGSNTQIQFNDSNNFGASANFTFNTATNLLTVTGNGQFNNANLGNLATANYVNAAVDVNVISNVNANIVNANSANFAGNISVTGNIANANNITVTNNLTTFSANVTANLTSGNANLGNLATANFVNVSTNVNVTGTMEAGNVRTDNLLYANGNPWDLQEAAGANTEIQYNMGDDFAASANFTFNDTTNLLTVTGNANVTNTLLTPNINSESSNLTLTSNGHSTVFDNTGNVTFPAGKTVTVGTLVGNVQANITITAANTSVLFSDAGLVAGATGFTFDKVSNVFSTPGNVDVNGNLLVTANAFIANTFTISPGQIQGPASGGGFQLVDYFNGVQLNWNNNNYIWLDNTGVNFEVANSIVANMDNTGKWTLPNDLSVLGNIANANNISVTHELAANTGNFSGNITSLNANLGNLISANYVNVANDLVTNNANVNLQLNGNTATFSGNVTVNNLGVNLELSGNTANFTSNVTVNNLTVNVNLEGNTANFSGNISSLNAVLGNIADANYIRTQEVYNGNTKIYFEANANLVFAATGANVVTVSNGGANVVGYIQANGEVAAGSVLTGNVTSNIGNLTLYAQQSGDSYIQLRTHGNGTIDAGNARIQDLQNPTNAQDAATKQYVDDVAQGLNVHDPVQAVTPDTLANITSGVITYNNGSNGVGAYLSTTGTYTTVDGVNIATIGTRILVKDEANAVLNGVYTYTNSTAITRAADFNSIPEVEAGDFMFALQGNLYANTGWVQTSSPTGIGTAGNNITFTQFSGVGTYSGANGINVTGTLITANVDNNTTEISGGNIIVKPNANLTTPNIGAATGTSLDLTGNILAANINANAAITANTANITTIANIGNIVVSDNILANSANINLALTGNTANFSGNVVTNNLTVNLELAGNTANFTGNVVANNFSTSGSGGNITGANVVSANTFVGNLDATTANISGNLTVNNLTVNLALAGNTANFTGNVVLPNLTVNLELAGNTANFTNTLVAGNLTTAGLANVGNLYVNANVTSDLLPNANLTLDLGSSSQRWQDVYVGNLDASGNITINGNTVVTSNVTANNVTANTDVNIGNSAIAWGQVTTTAITANQTIATYTVTDVTGIEYIVKGVDSTGAKYSMAIVSAVTDGANVDYATFGSVNLGGTTGTLTVNIVGSNVELQVTPSSSNSTIWTTQIRLI
jgi:hypothetical protein